MESAVGERSLALPVDQQEFTVTLGTADPIRSHFNAVGDVPVAPLVLIKQEPCLACLAVSSRVGETVLVLELALQIHQ